MPSLAEHYMPLIERERERAIGDLAALVRQAPGLQDAWRLLVLAHHRNLDFAACAEAARRLIALEPAHQAAHAYLANSLAMLGQDEDALAANEAARAVGVATGYAEARLLHRLGRAEAAAARYADHLADLPPDADEAAPALFGLMAASRDLGRADEADRAAARIWDAFGRRPMATSTLVVDRHHAFAFPEWVTLAHKANLARILQRGRAAEPEGARFPQTFVLPEAAEALAAFAREAPPGALFIGKPARGSGGHGIAIAPDPGVFAGRSDFVVQRYLERPYLIEGRKCHLRIYALVASAAPLRAYVCREGIVRLASEPYDLDPARLANVSAHITNTGLNETHPAFRLSDDPNAEDTGSARTLSALLRRVAADGFDAEATQSEIRALVGWFVRQLAREGMFERQAASAPPRAYPPKLIGFDILLDAAARPWLIEMQTSPGVIPSPMTRRLHGEICQNALRMTAGRGGDEAAVELANLGWFRPLDV